MSALALMVLTGCAPTLDDVHPSLVASDSGTIPFASAGTLNRTPTLG